MGTKSSTISRRQLLRGDFFADGREGRDECRPEASLKCEWVQIGKVADFPPDLVKEVLVYGHFIKVVSMAEGVQAILEPASNGSNNERVFLPLRLSMGGWLQAQIVGSAWSASVVLNLLTGEQYPPENFRIDVA